MLTVKEAPYILDNNKSTSYIDHSSSVLSAGFLCSLSPIRDLQRIDNNQIRFKLQVDKRGIELFINKLSEKDKKGTYFIKYSEKDSTIDITVSLKEVEEIKLNFEYAISKLNKYLEYKDLISRFTPGAGSRHFPGYSFEDYEFNS